MKLVVGLGNPGPRYETTRHNVGFRVVECFSRGRGIELSTDRFGGRFGRGSIGRREGEEIDVGVLEPQTFMNRSGDSVAAAVRDLPVEDLLVVYDDVDLPFGRLRIRPSGSAGGHRGLASIIAHLGRQDFPRLRFGIDRPPSPMDTVEYVLHDFSEGEAEELDAHIDNAATALECALVDGIVATMNRFNRDAP